MKSTITLEYPDRQIDDKSIVTTVKQKWVDSGNKVKDISSLNVYVKPNESVVYYVVNDTFTGQIII